MLDEPGFWVAVSIGGGLLAGAVLGLAIRRSLDRDGRRPALREIAGPLSQFAFWLSVAVGLVVALSTSSPETLSPIPARILEWLPNLAVAGVLLIVGYALGLVLSAAIGRSLGGATGVRRRSVERGARAVVVGGAGILALSQLGVDTTVLNILLGAMSFGICAALAGVAVVGGRTVSADLASGRALQSQLEVGDQIDAGDVSGAIVGLTPTHLLLEVDGRTVLVPYHWLAERPFDRTRP